MSKKLLRIVALILSALLTVTAVPCTVGAAGGSAREIEQQIIRTYQQAKAYFGRSSFDGACGTLVGAELYLMGITDSVLTYNGNEFYDVYSSQTVTSGGYRVRAYPAGSYSLLEALRTITEDGTKDVYDILVGFQRTRSSLGRLYGHACVIHAILDGTVYFMESYGVVLDGRYYPEGAPISCSMEAFARYCGNTTVSFDGVIHFTQLEYVDRCRSYPARLLVTAIGGAMRSQPCESRVDETSEHVRNLENGEELLVTGIYLDTEGEYWYQIGDVGYIRAGQAQLKELLFDDITISDPTAPTLLERGESYQVEGILRSGDNEIYTVRAQVYRLAGEEQTQMISATETVEDRYHDLSGSDVARELTFRKLTAGQYRYDLAAIVGNHFIQNGQLQTVWQTVSLWSSEFQVVEGHVGSGILTFDGCGGTSSVDQTAAEVWASVGALPTAKREGHVFLGWYTQPDGGERVQSDTVVEGDMVLYAHWIAEDALMKGLREDGQCLYFYSDGLTAMGCIELDGILFYFNSIDTPGRDHVMWTAAGTAGTTGA